MANVPHRFPTFFNKPMYGDNRSYLKGSDRPTEASTDPSKYTTFQSDGRSDFLMVPQKNHQKSASHGVTPINTNFNSKWGSLGSSNQIVNPKYPLDSPREYLSCYTHEIHEFVHVCIQEEDESVVENSVEPGRRRPSSHNTLVLGGHHFLNDQDLFKPPTYFHFDKKAISEADYRLFQEKLTTMQDNMALKDTKVWEDRGIEKGMSIHTGFQSGCAMFRTSCIIDLPLERILHLYRNHDFKKSYDTKLKEMKTLKELNGNIDIQYASISNFWPISERDLVVYSFCYYENSDKCIILGFDYPHKTEYPEKKGFVRVFNEFFGTVLTRKGKDQTEMTIVSKSNARLKGIPDWIVKTKLKEVALDNYKCKKALEEYYRPLTGKKKGYGY